MGESKVSSPVVSKQLWDDYRHLVEISKSAVYDDRVIMEIEKALKVHLGLWAMQNPYRVGQQGAETADRYREYAEYAQQVYPKLSGKVEASAAEPTVIDRFDSVEEEIQRE